MCTRKRSLHVPVSGSPGSLLAELRYGMRVHEEVNSPNPNGAASVSSQLRRKVAPTGPVTLPEMVTSNSSVTALGYSTRLTNAQPAAPIDTKPGCTVGVGVGVGVAVGLGVGVSVGIGVGVGVGVGVAKGMGVSVGIGVAVGEGVGVSVGVGVERREEGPFFTAIPTIPVLPSVKLIKKLEVYSLVWQSYSSVLKATREAVCCSSVVCPRDVML